MADSLAPWAFDVASLMVLIGEAEERRLRSSRSTLAEVLVAAPVAGIQSYLTSFEAVSSRLTYFSPYGCKEAPLRNVKLQSAINHLRLLDNGRYAAYSIKKIQKDEEQTADRVRHKYYHMLLLWLAFTWLYLAALILIWAFAPLGLLPPGTWVGITNLTVLTGWSILVRVLEYFMVTALADLEERNSKPRDKAMKDGIFFMGKRNSGLIICGTRQEIKMWTSTMLDYEEGRTFGFKNRHLQHFIRMGTIMVLLLVFVSVPNGSTTDQMVFVLLNILAQLNVFLSSHLNSKACIEELQLDNESEDEDALTRTHIWAYIIRHFHNRPGVDPDWIEKSRMLPDTPIWKQWREDILIHESDDPKELYDDLL